MLSADAIERIRKKRRHYPDARAAVLPALHIVQDELGHLPADAMRSVADLLNVPESEVYGTATFYALLRWKPAGRHVISVCHNLPCSLLGAETIMEHLSSALGVGEGQVTVDGKFSFQRIECIGRCDGAPAMLVDDDYHGNLTPEKIEGILKKYK
ncbi:MAG: NADH-quinone oxidoreductase subunit NuoE [Nitrospirae bacterium]|nr:NADH-quinone oxidoreductase subunit NuoE [Nitrospirota bacterium]